MYRQEDINKFYIDGFFKINLEEGQAKQKFDEMLLKIDGKHLSLNKNFKSSYSDTYDLIKKINSENKIIKEFVIEQKIIDKIESLTGHHYLLADMILRKTYSKKNSYMSMHRDSYFDANGQQIGRFPPLIKVIYYPQITKEDSIEKRMLLKPGSHHKVWKNYYVDKFLSILTSNATINNNKHSAIMFNTTIYHHACETISTNGAFRLILNFCVPSQINNFKANKEFKIFLTG